MSNTDTHTIEMTRMATKNVLESIKSADRQTHEEILEVHLSEIAQQLLDQTFGNESETYDADENPYSFDVTLTRATWMDVYGVVYSVACAPEWREAHHDMVKSDSEELDATLIELKDKFPDDMSSDIEDTEEVFSFLQAASRSSDAR